MFGNQAWAAAGYMVFKPHRTRAPHAWCKEDSDFCRASKGPEAWDVMVDDVMSGLDELIRRGLVDAGRICLYGYSNGAAVVNYLVTRTDRFKCAIAVSASLTDWVSPVFLTGEDWVTPMVGVKPWEDPAAYIKLSAVFHVDKVKTPILLAVGDKDGGFQLGTIRMYNALRFAGKEVTLLRYPDQGHVFTGTSLRDLWQRQMEFFHRYLKMEERSEGSHARKGEPVCSMAAPSRTS